MGRAGLGGPRCCISNTLLKVADAAGSRVTQQQLGLRAAAEERAALDWRRRGQDPGAFGSRRALPSFRSFPQAPSACRLWWWPWPLRDAAFSSGAAPSVETSQNRRADPSFLGQVGLRTIRGTKWQKLPDRPSTFRKAPDFSVTASFRFGSGVFTFTALSISQLNLCLPFLSLSLTKLSLIILTCVYIYRILYVCLCMGKRNGNEMLQYG